MIRKIIDGVEYTFVPQGVDGRNVVVDMSSGYKFESTAKPLTMPTVKIKTLDEVFDLKPQWGGQVVECEEDGKLYQYVGWQELEFHTSEKD